MRLIARFSKTDNARFVSHLDVQRLFGRAFRRANIPVAYSQGFNPHPVLSFATALSTGVASDAEWLDVKLDSLMGGNDFIDAMNAVMPSGFRVLDAYTVDDKLPSLTALLSCAEYAVVIRGGDADLLAASLDTLMSGPIMTQKHTKGGIKTVDIRPMVYEAKIVRTDEDIVLLLKGVLNASGSLNADAFTNELFQKAGITADYSIRRTQVGFIENQYLPEMISGVNAQ